MYKLIQGIKDFRKHRIEEYREKFSKLALGQSPDTLFVACSDSRVVPNLFASTDPGDLFVVRNVGNLIPRCDSEGHSQGDMSEWAGIEFAVLHLKVSNIVVCGHSECGAIRAIIQGREKITGEHIKIWLEHGERATSKMAQMKFPQEMAEHNRVSQANVLLQLDHLKTYPLIQEKMNQGDLHIFGWWFDIATGNVYIFSESSQCFELIA